jgi:indolepyruvate ferredoxin oxidoreductase beta subunit
MTETIPTTNFVLVGVGGQGTILASDVLAEVGVLLGYDVKKAEVHGMSQRGGSVISGVRWGEKVYSPIIARGEADYLVAFEKSETPRYIDHLRSGGVVLINNYQIVPLTVSSGNASYPTDEQIREVTARFTEKTYWVDGVGIAEKVGNFKAANAVLLGTLSKVLNIPSEKWLDAIARHVPVKLLELNRLAFEAGRAVKF